MNKNRILIGFIGAIILLTCGFFMGHGLTKISQDKISHDKAISDLKLFTHEKKVTPYEINGIITDVYYDGEEYAIFEYENNKEKKQKCIIYMKDGDKCKILKNSICTSLFILKKGSSKMTPLLISQYNMNAKVIGISKSIRGKTYLELEEKSLLTMKEFK